MKNATLKQGATQKRILHWITGDETIGFKIVTKRPRTKIVNEPYSTREAAERAIAMYFLSKE